MTDELAPKSPKAAIGFAQICEEARLENGAYHARISQNWKQGRTAYGGITLGLIYAAAQSQHAPLPDLRSVQINYTGPVTSDPYFKTEVLRKGRNVTSVQGMGFVGADERADERAAQIIASANLVFGAARNSVLSQVLPAPDAPPPEACEPLTPEFARSMVPQFFHNFDTRLIAGARPVSGASEGYIRTWSRHKDETSRSGMASLLSISDVLPPAAMPMLTAMAPVSSVNFTLNILVDNPQTDDGWWHIETRLTAAQDGYASQIMRIWNTDGVLVAEGVQCVAVFI